MVQIVFPVTQQALGGDFLVYLDLFKPAEPDEQNVHGLYQVTRAFQSDGTRTSTIVPIANIRRSVHLIPKFDSPCVNCDDNADNVLEVYNTFYINSFSDRHAYFTMI